MTIFSTRRLMRETNPKNLLGTFSFTACCCWWMPLVFFLGAANVADTCKVNLSLWLKLCGILLVGIVPIAHVFYVCSSKFSAACCFKLARLVMLSAPLVYIIYSLSGFPVYVNVSEEECVKE